MEFIVGFFAGVFATIMVAAVWATWQLAHSLDKQEWDE